MSDLNHKVMQRTTLHYKEIQLARYLAALAKTTSTEINKQNPIRCTSLHWESERPVAGGATVRSQ